MRLLPSTIRRPGIAFALVGFFFASVAVAVPFKGTIRAEGTSGDLVVVLREGKPVTFRLYGVASPVAGQPMAESGTTHLLETAMETTVTVEIVGDDLSGIPVAWIRLPDGISLNEQLVRQGLAWWDAPNTPEARHLQKAATEAIAAGRGLWATPAPLAPWDYRKSHNLEAIQYKKSEPDPASVTSPKPVESVPTLKAEGDGDYFPEDPAEHMALMLKHQPRIIHDKEGRPVGLTADEISSVPGAGRVGLQNGDIIRSVNGIALTDEAQVLGLVTQLQGAKQLDLKVQRNGAITNISIPLE